MPTVEPRFGWAGPRNAIREWDRLQHLFIPFSIKGQVGSSGGKRACLWDAAKEVTGGYLPNIPQQIGDCFIEGTMVRTPDSEKPIETIQPGEKVISHLNVAQKVIRTVRKPYDGPLVTVCGQLANRRVTSTPDHQFFCPADKTWLPVGDREAQIRLQVTESWRYDSRQPVYCLEVEKDNSFIANGYAVHNCVSFGAASAIDHLACWEIARLKQPERFRKAFQPYIYGTSRVQIGGGRLGNSDGSLGSWGAQAMLQYGILPSDAQGVPTYSGNVAKTWGRSGPPKEMLDFAKPFVIKSAAEIGSYEAARDALTNGYALTYASNRGHAMDLQLDQATGKGWHHGNDTWPHQRCVIAVDDDPKRPGVFVLNSWGAQAHVPNNDGPTGGGWFDAEEFDRDLHKSGVECFALSLFDGFPADNFKPSFILI